MNAGGIRNALSEIETDEEFARLVAGKRVIVVGPAESLLESGLGVEIDSYDLVVRFNTAIEYMPFEKEIAQHVGSRTDILYFNNQIMMDRILLMRGMSHEKFFAACEQIKFLVVTNNGFTYPDAGDSPPRCVIEGSAFDNFLRVNHVGAKLRMLFSTSIVVRKLLNGYVGRTGFIAIVDLLRYEPSELRIAGMTFYHKGGHMFLKDHATELHPLRDHLGRDTNKEEPGHNSYVELEVMKRLVQDFAPVIKIDDQLQELFGGSDG